MGDVVMAPHLLLAARAPDALDHRIVVERVGQDEAVRQQAGDRRDAGEIGDPAGGEDEGGRLAVQIGELRLELHDRVMRAGNVAGSAGARAMGARCANRRLDHVGMAAHAQIVVRAPDGDLAGTVFFARGTPLRHREPARVALEIGEGAIALFRLQTVDRLLKAPLVIHRPPLFARPCRVVAVSFANGPQRSCPEPQPRRRRGALSQFARSVGNPPARYRSVDPPSMRRDRSGPTESHTANPKQGNPPGASLSSCCPRPALDDPH